MSDQQQAPQKKVLVTHKFEVDYNDHFETPSSNMIEFWVRGHAVTVFGYLYAVLQLPAETAHKIVMVARPAPDVSGAFDRCRASKNSSRPRAGAVARKQRVAGWRTARRRAARESIELSAEQ